MALSQTAREHLTGLPGRVVFYPDGVDAYAGGRNGTSNMTAVRVSYSPTGNNNLELWAVNSKGNLTSGAAMDVPLESVPELIDALRSFPAASSAPAPTAVLLARAVLAGDRQAAAALYDHLTEVGFDRASSEDVVCEVHQVVNGMPQRWDVSPAAFREHYEGTDDLDGLTDEDLREAGDAVLRDDVFYHGWAEAADRAVAEVRENKRVQAAVDQAVARVSPPSGRMVGVCLLCFTRFSPAETGGECPQCRPSTPGDTRVSPPPEEPRS